MDEDSPLMRRARDRAVEILGAPPGSRWVAGEPLSRRRSYLVPFELVGPEGPVLGAFSKKRLEPGPRGVEGARAALDRAHQASPALRATARRERIAFPLTLAVDLEELASVETLVPGDHPWPRVHQRTARRAELYRAVGRAVRLLEDSCPLPTSGEPSTWPLDFDPWAPDGLLSADEAEAVRARLAELYDAARSEGHPVSVWHGDLSSSNLLVSSAGVGVIDISWELAFRGTDLVVLAWRLELERPQLRARSAAMIDALLAGYGDPALTTGPAWRFERLRRLTHGLSRPAALGPLRGRGLNRMLGEVRAELRG